MIIRATIEENGWVLAVTHTAPATSSSFPFSSGSTGYSPQHPAVSLTPDADPRVMLTVQSAPGTAFARAGGQAVPATHTRVIVATMPMRRAHPEHLQLWEDEDPDDTTRRTVRLALSDRLHEGETVIACTFAPGWRTGATIEESVAVTNNSTRTPPVPIMRWACIPYVHVDGRTDTFHVELAVAAHYPQASGAARNQAVAAVRFVAYDHNGPGQEVWVTQPTKSDAWGGSGGEMEVWSVEAVAAGLFAGLRAGPVSVHATVYPWLGTVRSTGAELHTNIDHGRRIEAERALIVAWDPAGARYQRRYVAVDPANGVTTVASITVSDNWATARDGTRAANLSVAEQALRRPFAAVTGGAAAGDSAQGGIIRLMPGVTVNGGGGSAATETWVTVESAPEATVPFEQVWRSDTSLSGGNRWRFRNMRVERGASSLGTGNTRSFWFDAAQVHGASGSTINASGAPTSDLEGRHFGTGALFSGGVGGYAGGNLFHTVRGCRGAINGVAILAHFCARGAGTPYTVWGAAGDCMMWNVTAVRATNSSGQFPGTPSSSDSRHPSNASVWRRFAAINCLVERMGPSSNTQPFGQIGENSSTSLQDSIFEGVSTVGARLNWHNDPPASTPTNFHIGNVVRNCWWDRQGTKHDDFLAEPKPDAIGSWEQLYGVGWEGNVLNNRINTSPANFQYAFAGRRAAVNTAFSTADGSDWPKYTLDRSARGPSPATGNDTEIDYRPLPESPAEGRGVVANTRFDLEGLERSTSFAAGAYRGSLVLAPDASRMLHLALSGRLSVGAAAAVLAPAVARHGCGSAEVALHVRGRAWALTASNARHALRDRPPLLDTALPPADPRLRTMTILQRGHVGRANPR